MDRKTFIQKSAGALLLAAPAYVLLNCSSDDDSNNNPQQGGNPDCIANGTSGTIGSNHGHTISVPVADINAATDKTYDIQGTSDHPHQVTITSAMFAMLANSQAVSATSTSDAGHSHSITISCA